jgi:hypothetical protein
VTLLLHGSREQGHGTASGEALGCCTHSDGLARGQRAAGASTIALGAASLTMITSGAWWLARRKHANALTLNGAASTRAAFFSATWRF